MHHVHCTHVRLSYVIFTYLTAHVRKAFIYRLNRSIPAIARRKTLIKTANQLCSLKTDNDRARDRRMLSL